MKRNLRLIIVFAVVLFLSISVFGPVFCESGAETKNSTSGYATSPFFKALKDYVERNEDPWCTPGHQAGEGFQENEAGKEFYEFFGENIFRADVSSSMSELGSILGHSGPVKEAEDAAAKNFGADYTFFVTNGTSTSNKIVFHSAVTEGDIVLADRNCHKSTMHAMIMTRAIPVYLHARRNAYGIIGPIKMREFDESAIRAKIKDSALIPKDKKNQKAKLSVVTNSTYDGLCYDVATVKNKLAGLVDNIMFDEAWYAYAKFHPLYKNRFAMCQGDAAKVYPPIFATQSTHKMLTAFSMASMIHIKNGTQRKIDPEIFNEAWLMHTTTSPFYPMVASLDVASRMMAISGKKIVDGMLEEAIYFRKKMVLLGGSQGAGQKSSSAWWFGVWQPRGIEIMDDSVLMNDPSAWTLKPGDSWHGFSIDKDENVLLDPIKVTILTPGITEGGTMLADGIPAPVVAKFLMDDLIVPEKVGFYNLLFLFPPGVSREKSDRLLQGFLKFKELYESNVPVKDIFPELVKEYPGRYEKIGLKDLCRQMHLFLRSKSILSLMEQTYLVVPPQSLLPADAYESVVRGNVEYVDLKRLNGRISAVILAPYPPGIPIVMPGERFTNETQKIVDYFFMVQELDNTFPGFEIEVHGMKVDQVAGKNIYKVLCIKK